MKRTVFLALSTKTRRLFWCALDSLDFLTTAITWPCIRCSVRRRVRPSTWRGEAQRRAPGMPECAGAAAHRRQTPRRPCVSLLDWTSVLDARREEKTASKKHVSQKMVRPFFVVRKKWVTTTLHQMSFCLRNFFIIQ